MTRPQTKTGMFTLEEFQSEVSLMKDALMHVTLDKQRLLNLQYSADNYISRLEEDLQSLSDSLSEKDILLMEQAEQIEKLKNTLRQMRIAEENANRNMMVESFDDPNTPMQPGEVLQGKAVPKSVVPDGYTRELEDEVDRLREEVANLNNELCLTREK